jgi:hypothetical protein
MSFSLSRSDYYFDSQRSTSGWRRGLLHFRAFALTLCFLLMCAAFGWTWLKRTVHDELQHHLASEINRRLQDSSFECQLGTVRWTEGKGLRVSEIRFLDRKTRQSVAECQQLLATSAFQLTDILSGKPVIESLTIDGLQLDCRRDAAGKWNVMQLIEAMQSEDADLEIRCPVRIRNSRARIDGTPWGLEQAIELRDINLDHRRQNGQPDRHQALGYLSTDFCSRLGVDLEFDGQQGTWQARCQAERLEIDNRVLATRLPWPSLRGHVSLNGAAAGRLNDSQSIVFRVTGRAAEVQCLDPALPHPVHDGSFDFSVDNQDGGVPKVRVRNAGFRIGYGHAKLDLDVEDPWQQPRWRVTGQLGNFQLTDRVLEWVSPPFRQAWHQFQPAGNVDATFDISYQNGQFTRQVKSVLRDGSLSWYRFPFRVSGCSGKIDWIGDLLTIDLDAVEAQQLIAIEGEIRNPGDSWSGWLEGHCDGQIPINEKLLQAFDTRPGLARVLRRFRATGHVNGHGRIERVAGSSTVNKTFQIWLRQATVRHETFDYPIYNVHGLVHVVNDRTEFRQIRGQNNNAQIECNGSWSEDHGLQLRFLANDVLLNHELRAALPENLQTTWQGLRPSGTVHFVNVDLHNIPGNRRPLIDVTVSIPPDEQKVSSVSINPVWFPWEMRQVTGTFHFENQRIDIRNFAARHGKTRVSANGTGAWNESAWRLRFSEMLASNIVLDDALGKALPPSLSRGLDWIKFDGNLGMRGSLELAGAFDPISLATALPHGRLLAGNQPQPPTANLAWDLEFGLARAKANLGIPISNANGVIRLSGRYAGGDVRCRGTMNIDSMMYRDMQITSLTAPLSVDNQLIGFGALATAANNDKPAPSATARLFGGYVECDGQIRLDGDNEYYLQADLTDGRLQQFAAETSMQHHDLSGQATADIRLRGNASGTHSIRGNGQIQLRNAKIYEVPVIFALLDVLSIKEPDRTAFDQAQMEFTVAGENFDFQRIELNGDAISLIGQGTVNMNSEIDLDFYTTMGRNRWYIPVLTQLYHAGSKQIWWVKVDGTLEAPLTSHEMLPGINDSLKKLFPELAEPTR